MVSIIIRTLNEAADLERLLDVIKQQDYPGRIELVVVDNQSDDSSVEVAKQSGSKLVTITRREFTYPKSLNAGMHVARGEIAILTVGHAWPVRGNWISSALKHFEDPKVAGVYADVVPRPDATIWEKINYWPSVLRNRLGLRRHARSKTGVFGATNIALRRSLWQGHQFDESYESGGEDGAWAAWATSQGYRIIDEPDFAVYHSHGLGPVGLWRQNRYWKTIDQPKQFDRRKLAYRRRTDWSD